MQHSTFQTTCIRFKTWLELYTNIKLKKEKQSEYKNQTLACKLSYALFNIVSEVSSITK